MPKYDIGELIAALNEAVNKLNNLRAKYDDLEKENARLREALLDLLNLCSHADFKNGVTDASGTMDEGEHWAAVYQDRARAALGEKE